MSDFKDISARYIRAMELVISKVEQPGRKLKLKNRRHLSRFTIYACIVG